jgi:hypothetical protein
MACDQSYINVLAFIAALGWTTGFVSPVSEWHDEVPTVVEAVTHWTASSMGFPGADEPTSELPCTVQDLMAQSPVVAMALFLF